jgi:thioredoxin 1
MTQRILILFLIAALFILGYLALRVWTAWRLRGLQARNAPLAGSPLADAFAEIAAGGPALLYFTTATCAQCRFQQTPILQQLQAEVNALLVITFDAAERQELTRHFGILTVPSTVLLDSRRLPVAINHGVAPLQKLRTQVEGLVIH